MVVQRMIAGRHDLIPAGYAAKIGAIRGVSEVSGTGLWGYYYDPVFQANYTCWCRTRHRRHPVRSPSAAALPETCGSIPVIW